MRAVDSEAPPAQKQDSKDSATGSRKESKRKTEEVESATNTAPEPTKRKKTGGQVEGAPAVAKSSKKKKRASEAPVAPSSTPAPEEGPEPQTLGSQAAQGRGASRDSPAAGEGLDDPVKKKARESEDVAVPEQARRGKRRRRKGGRVGEEEGLTAAEQQRRNQQRHLRRLALQMRAGGRSYKRPPQKKAKTEPQKAGLYSPSQLQDAAQQGDDQGSRPDQPVQVVVVPIFWNRKPEEKAQVIRAAEAIVKLLKAAGLATGADTTTAMSPGQKFAYWEGQGVVVRIECGPRDTLHRECVLAVSKKAGGVAERQTIPVGPELVGGVGRALGTSATPPDMPGKGEAPGGSALQPVGVKRVAASGDDLGGDFGELHVDDSAGSNKKRKKWLGAPE